MHSQIHFPLNRTLMTKTLSDMGESHNLQRFIHYIYIHTHVIALVIKASTLTIFEEAGIYWCLMALISGSQLTPPPD